MYHYMLFFVPVDELSAHHVRYGSKPEIQKMYMARKAAPNRIYFCPPVGQS